MGLFRSRRYLQSFSAAVLDLAQRRGPLLARFASISALSTLTYVSVASFAGLRMGLDGKLTVLLAYAAALPLNFIGHRNVTFRSHARPATQVVKFLLAHATVLALSTASMALVVDYFKLPIVLGLVVSTASIIILSFVLLGGWVFRN